MRAAAIRSKSFVTRGQYNNALRKHADTTPRFIEETISNWHPASFLKVIDFCLTVWTRQRVGKFIKIIPVDDKAARSIDACKYTDLSWFANKTYSIISF
jgi:hypothetical protein